MARAADEVPEPERNQAREVLCHTYWYPMYVYLRRRGQSPADAEDLVQGFFVHLFAKDVLAQADAGRGRFRTFLLCSLDNYVLHEHRHGRAIKRGGDRQFFSLADFDAERRQSAVAAREPTPEAAFDRAWAMTVLEMALERLREEHADRPEQFEVLSQYLTADDQQVSYAETAARLGISPLSVRVAVHRLRARYRGLLDQHLLSTAGDGSDLAAERAELFHALGL